MLINIEEGIRFVQPSIKEETQLFQIFSVYLYYLSCLKIDSFNPEKWMRTALLWEWNKNILSKNSSKLFWACLYRMHKIQISNMLGKKISKSEFLNTELKKTFEYKTKEKVYTLKECYIETVKNEIKDKNHKEKIEKALCISFNSKIHLFTD